MQITRIYADAEGESWFEDIELDTKPKGPGLTSNPFGVGKFTLRETPGPSTQDWHVAPMNVYVVLLSGAVEIEVSSGTKRRFSAGDILLAEDTEGKGHKTTTISEGVRQTLFITAREID
jgi:quercetin dioxygenase-like cupin family protein